MKVLVLHHIEPEYQDFFNSEDLFRELFKHLRRDTYDRIILSTLSGIIYPDLRGTITEHREWDYLWESPFDAEYESWYSEYGYDRNDVIPVPTVHKWTYLYDWIKSLKGHAVTVASGLRGECLLDLETALSHLGISFTRLEQCCYG